MGGCLVALVMFAIVGIVLAIPLGFVFVWYTNKRAQEYKVEARTMIEKQARGPSYDRVLKSLSAQSQRGDLEAERLLQGIEAL